MRNSAKSMMSCERNTSNGSRRVAVNRISTGKTGRLPMPEPGLLARRNPAKERARNTPLLKIWKISLAVIHRIPTFSPISLAVTGTVDGQATSPGPRRGRDVEYEVNLTLEEAFHGAERLLDIDGHRIKAGIPPGVRTGSRVRLAGQAEPGQNGGPAGDLYLIVQISPNETFEREGDNLHMDVPVDIFTAVAGGEVRIPGLERPLTLKIPPRTNANRTFRIRGKGMPHLRDTKKRGDLFARVRLVLPDPLTDEEVSSMRELAASRSNRSKTHPDEEKI